MFSTFPQLDRKDHTLSSNNQVIAVIGKGNMAKTVIGGLINKGVSAKRILISSPSINGQPFINMNFNGNTYEIKVAQTNREAVERSASVILVVKPFNAEVAINSFADVLNSKPLISAMAGITTQSIRGLLNSPLANVVRLMPNTPATIGMGIGATFQAPDITLSKTQQKDVNDIKIAFGCPIQLSQEYLLNSVTATSGSGAAYVFLLVEYLLEIYSRRNLSEKLAINMIQHNFEIETQSAAPNDALLIRQFKNYMKQCAVDMSIEQEDATTLVDQTFIGAMALIKQAINNEPTKSKREIVATLRNNVTSKGGTTFAALECFRNEGLLDILEPLMSPTLCSKSLPLLLQRLDMIIKQAMTAANNRAEEMAKEAESSVSTIIKP
jgi:pyrroline-5-carboxylate reductase